MPVTVSLVLRIVALLAAMNAAPVVAQPASASSAPTAPTPSPTASTPLPAAAAPAPTIATITIPGDARFVRIARDVLVVQSAVTPDFAAQSGLVDDALQAPSFAPAQRERLTRRLRADMAALRALPWRRWSVDEQIDVRWIYANAQRLDRELNVEQLYRHRPGAWLETLANDYIAILTYAPARTDAISTLARQVPAMVDEMQSLCQPTQVDAQVATGVLDGLVAMLRLHPDADAQAALAALARYRTTLASTTDAPAFTAIGARNYAWRLRHAELLPWTPAQLLALANRRIVVADKELAALRARLPAPGPLPPDLEQQAVDLDQVSLLKLYDRIQEQNRAAVVAAGFVTIPDGVGPIKARVTPDAMVPLTGDGGSMNPPPPFVADDTGWWNVEHFDPKMSLHDREETVREAALFRLTDMGPYAAHEGWPGHHLQLGIARLNPDPLRSLFQDAVQNEGWALYAEQEMWAQGGLGPSPEARAETLDSARFRMRRVVYDVNVETGVWTLQQASDWKERKKPGESTIGTDVKRAINWPGQLICYFAGKEQILALKADYRRKMGARYSERRFHDELLALGSVPYVFARAKMLGEPVPAFDR